MKLRKLQTIFLLNMFFIIISTSMFAQIYAPQGLNMPGTWNEWTNPPVNNLYLASSTQVEGGQITNIDLETPHYQTVFSTFSTSDFQSGTFDFLFTSGPEDNIWQNKWANVEVQLNTIQTYTFGGQTDNSISLNENKFYTMNWENIGYSDTRAIFMETSAEPVEITSVIHSPMLPEANQQITVSVTLSGVKSPEEKIYLNYTTNSWASSHIVNVTVNGTNGTAVIPGHSTNTEIEYYVFSTTISNPTEDFDLITINYNNNQGENYSFIVDQQIECGSTISLVSTEPPFPLDDEQVIITFNAILGNAGLAGYDGDVYAHTGVLTDLSTSDSDWKYVKTEWGENTPDTKLTRIDEDLYELNISNIREYYGVPENEDILQMAFVFRSGEPIEEGGTQYYEAKNLDGSDIFIETYDLELNVKILSPSKKDPLANPSEVLPVCIAALEANSIDIYVDDLFIVTESGPNVTYGLSTNTLSSGLHWLYAFATDGNSTVKDSVPIYVKGEINVEPLPNGITGGGVYYLDNNSVTLVLHDPAGYKDFVFVIGDFNDWVVCDEGYMNVTPDGKYFWKTISDLTPNVEYTYQFYIDGELKIADPYCHKILDPWNDKWIPENTYPSLLDYPNNFTTGIVSVLETGQEEFDWQIDDFTPIAVNETQSNLVIYELLIRDFDENRNIKSVTQRLDYLQTLGVTAIQLMPFNEFEGNDSWGYNPSFYFAVDKAYGTEEDYKEFIDECHQRGIAVIMDMVLNHSFGMSPMVQMYMDEDYNPTPENPWFNVTATHPFSVGADFNHESPYTRQFCKDVLTFWLEEYKIDGYRFDLSKGFTQNYTLGDVGAWSAYDQSRVDIWTDYYNHMKSVNPNTYVILEHLASNDEEKVLANMGFMLWANMNEQFNQTTMGWEENSDFSWAYYANRDFTFPNLIPYMESHDEERLMYRNLEFGNTGTNTVSEALQRMKAIVPFYITIPGPKMIWQFGELGYDYSINYCPDGTISEDCRTSAKPIRWDYFSDSDRQDLYWVYAQMIKLKTEQAAFREGSFSMDLSGMGKRMWIAHEDLNVVIAANFSDNGFDMQPGFQHSGIYYDYFTGEEINVDVNNQPSVYFEPGDFHVWLDQNLTQDFVNLTFEVINSETETPVNEAIVSIEGFADYLTDENGEVIIDIFPNETFNYTVSKKNYASVSGTITVGEENLSEQVELVPTVSIFENNQQLVNIFPNPNNGTFTVDAGENYKLSIFDLSGKIIYQENIQNGRQFLDISNYGNGIYLIQFRGASNIFYKKIIINE